MLAKVRSCAVIGLEGALIEVEVDLSNGLAGFMIVGLPDTALYVYRHALSVVC
jgi:magnesium chelatase family protein